MQERRRCWESLPLSRAYFQALSSLVVHSHSGTLGGGSEVTHWLRQSVVPSANLFHH